MLRRGAREDRPGPVGGGGGRTHYQMRQKMVSIGDDFWIENDRGEKVYKVDGKALRVRQTLILEDARGKELYKIQERMLRVKDSMEVEDAGGQRVAMVKKALITPIRERWTVKVKGGPDLEVQGNILDHEYTIGEGRDQGGGSLQEVVPPARHLRRGDRPGPGRRPDPRGCRLHRRDGPSQPVSQMWRTSIRSSMRTSDEPSQRSYVDQEHPLNEPNRILALVTAILRDHGDA